MHTSHVTYEYFRSYFLGNKDAVKKRLDALWKLMGDDSLDGAQSVEDLVEDKLKECKGTEEDFEKMDALAELLKAISSDRNLARVYRRRLQILC